MKQPTKTQIMDSLSSLHRRVSDVETKMVRLATEVRKWQEAMLGRGAHMTQGYMAQDGSQLMVKTPEGMRLYAPVPAAKGRRAAYSSTVRKTRKR